MKSPEQFYNYLSRQFSDLKSARLWLKKFLTNNNTIPGYGKFNPKVMCHHVSNVLEGKTKPEKNFNKVYYSETEYGQNLYQTIWHFGR